jgi:hypothetical protein
LTGEILAVPYTYQFAVQVDGDQSFAIPPSPNGGWDGYIDAGPGVHIGQSIVDGNAFGDPFEIDAGQSGRVHILIDASGTVLTVEPVDTATLKVTKTDANGSPIGGACFTVYIGDKVAGQECDVSDGNDGTTSIRFPNSVPGGDLTLAETGPPPHVADLTIHLGPGDNQIQVTSGG